MYDMAKRSLACTVATGGLLLTGTGYAPADTAVGSALSPGQAQAQGSGGANGATPSSVSTPINVREAQVPPRTTARDSIGRMPQRLRADDAHESGGGATTRSEVEHSGGILSGNTIQIPIDLGLNLCGNQVAVAGARNTDGHSSCSSSSGASAESSTEHSGGVASGNTIQAPVNLPLNICGNQAVVAGVLNAVAGSKCAAGGRHDSDSRGSGGANATAETHHSGGVLSGNVVQAPVNVPLNLCGNQVVVGGIRNFTGRSKCSNGEDGSGSPGGANATAVVTHSGGVLSGNIVQAPIDVPVNICGNGVEALAQDNFVGDSKCSTKGGRGPGGAHAVGATVDSGGLGAGNVVQVPIDVPVNVCGNQVAVAAADNRVRGSVCVQSAANATGKGATVRSGGLAAGNVVSLPINVPVNLCGNQVAVAGVKNVTGPSVCVEKRPRPVECEEECESASPSPSESESESESASPSPSMSESESQSASPSPSMSESESESASASPSPSMSRSQSQSASPSASASESEETPTGGPETVSPGPGKLAHTGTDAGLLLGVAGAAVLGGLGARAASRRRAAKH